MGSILSPLVGVLLYQEIGKLQLAVVYLHNTHVDKHIPF